MDSETSRSELTSSTSDSDNSRAPTTSFQYPSPISTTPRKILSTSGRALALSNSARKPNSTTSLRSGLSPFHSHSCRSFSNLREDLDGNDPLADQISPPASPSTPTSSTVIMSSSGRALAVTSPGRQQLGSFSSARSTRGVSFSGRSTSLLLTTNSAKRMDQRTMFVKQVTGKHKNTEIHLVAQKGDVGAVRQILAEIDNQMTSTDSGAEFDSDLADIRTAIVNEVNTLGETALFIAAEKGYLGVVNVLLPYMTKEGLLAKNRSGLDALHVAAAQGHEAIIKVLLTHDPELIKTLGPSNTSPLITAAMRGHLAAVNELLRNDSSLLEVTKTNGKNALHLTARQGHLEVVQALLRKDLQLARRTDKKGQTALHMAVKGQSSEVVRLLLEVDPALVTLPDRSGNTALHIATRKRRVAIVKELLLASDINVNAITKERKTSLDIAEGLLFSEQVTQIRDTLAYFGAVKASELSKRRDELRLTVTEIQKNVHCQLEQARRTNRNVDGIAKELKRLHRQGVSNAANSVTVVAVLFATVAFAAIFTVPGGDNDNGTAVMASHSAFQIFFIFNAVSLFTSLAVVVVQMTLVRGETKAERRVVEVINKLMWLASMCTTVAFLSSAYIVVGRHHKWAGIFVMVLGASTMTGVLGTMTYFVVFYRRIRKMGKRKKEKSYKDGSVTQLLNSGELSEMDANPIYAI